MRILVLSFYYEPDLCAGSFRNTALVRSLSDQLGSDGQVDVITTLPNRYNSFLARAPEHEVNGNVHVRRIPLPAHQSGMADQSRAFASYVKAVWRGARGESYDVVYASSSRLMTAALGAAVARRLSVPLYLDIRDIFTDSMGDLLRHSPLRVMLPFFRLIERLAVRQANRVNLVSPGFVEHFRAVDKGKDFRLFTNGIDEEFLDRDFSRRANNVGPKEILYAGNIGEGQGLHRIIPGAAEKLGPGWRFRVIGDGGMRPALEQLLVGIDNVVLEPPVQRAELLERYQQADVLFLHLNDYPAFRKVLPSKSFEYGATGKPILAGVAGQAAKFVRDNIENAAVFTPCDVNGLVAAINTLRLEDMPRSAFVQDFCRTRIVQQLAEDILELGRMSRKAARRDSGRLSNLET